MNVSDKNIQGKFSDRFMRWALYALFWISSFSLAGATGAALILGFHFFYKIWFDPEWRPFSLSLWKPILCFFLVAVISALLTENPLESLKEIRELWRFILPFAIWKIFKEIDQDKFLKGFLFILVIFSIYGIIQYFFGVDWFRPEGYKKITPYMPDGISTGVFHAKGNFSHHLTYSHYLLLIFPLFISLGFVVKDRIFRFGSIFGSCVMLTALVLSLGRSAWLGAIIALGILSFRLPNKLKLLFFILGMTGIISVIITNQLSNSFKEYRSPISSALKARVDSILTLRHHRDRIFLWETAILAIKDNFLFGIGLNNDKYVMPPYRKIVENKRQHKFINAPSAGIHNIYLQIWLNLGIVGFCCYIWMWGNLLVFIAKNIIKSAKNDPRKNALLWGLLAGFSGFMFAGIFENSFQDGEVQTLLFALVGYTLSFGNGEKSVTTI